MARSEVVGSPRTVDLSCDGEPEDLIEVVSELRSLAALTTDIAAALTQSDNLADALHCCVEILVRGLDAAFARIWTLEENENILKLQASAGMYTHLDGPHSRILVGQYKIGLIAQERRPHLTNEVIGDPLVGDQDWARREGMVAFAGHPLFYKDRVCGVMALFCRKPLSCATLRALATVAESVSNGIAHGRAMDALRASEERFVLALRGTDEGLWDWNVVTGEVYYSPRFKDLLGYQEQEMENQFREFEVRLHAEDHDRVMQEVENHLRDRHPYQIDYRLRTKQGNYRWFHARGQALWDGAGRAVRMLGSISDVHERKKSEELFRGLLESSPDALVIVNESGAVALVNRQAEQLFGYGRDELLGQPVEQLVRAGQVHWRDRGPASPYQRPMGAVPAFGARRAGGEFPAEISLSPLRTVDGLFVSCVVRDITERKALEDALRESEERNRAVVKNIVDGIITIDESGAVKAVNPAAEKMFGYPAEALLGRNVGILLPQLFQSAHDGRLDNHASNGVAKVVGVGREIACQRRDGSTFPGELSISEYQMRGRRIFTGTIRDVTRRKLTEKRLAAAHQVALVLAESISFTEAMPRILHTICENLDWSVGGYWVLDRPAKALRCAEFWTSPGVAAPEFEAASRRLVCPCGVGLPGRTWASRRVEWIADVTRDANFPRAAEAAQGGLRGGIAFPILFADAIHGVMDFVSREIQRPDEELVQIFEDIAAQISRFIDLGQAQQRVRTHDQESAIARAIQQDLFPKTMPVLEGYEIAGGSEPARATGGDYFDFIPFSNGHLLLAIGDVSGKGLGAAMVMTQAHAYLRAFALMGLPIDTIVNLANARLAEVTNDSTFFTLCLGWLNPFSRSLVYCNAGHGDGYVFGLDGAVSNVLASSDLPLGIDPGQVYQKSSVVQLQPGDLVLLLTDGVFEAFSPDGEAFGMPRVLDFVRAARDLPPAHIIAGLFDEVRRFTQGTPHDDMTAVVVKVAVVA